MTVSIGGMAMLNRRLTASLRSLCSIITSLLATEIISLHPVCKEDLAYRLKTTNASQKRVTDMRGNYPQLLLHPEANFGMFIFSIEVNETGIVLTYLLNHFL